MEAPARKKAFYFQLANPAEAPVDLAEYTIAYCANGCEFGRLEFTFPFPSDAIIPARGVYTVCSKGLPDKTGCDHVSPRLQYGENDFFSLMKGTYTNADVGEAPLARMVDQIGTNMAVSPGASWPVCGLDSGFSTADGLLLRDVATTCGDTSGSAFDGSDLRDSDCPWRQVGSVSSVSSWRFPLLTPADPTDPGSGSSGSVEEDDAAPA